MTPAAATVAVRSTLSTPSRLRFSLILVVALAAAAAVASLWAASTIHDAAQTVGRDAEPSVALALRMAATLRDMDAAALADSLTDSGSAIGASVRFQAGLDHLAADAVAAARNITYGEAEAAPLTEMQRMLALYQEAIVEARYIGRGNAWLASRRVQWASRVNRELVTPQAEALAAVNADQLEGRYASYRATSLPYGGAAFAAFAALVAALLGVQAWLAQRTRRLLNPMLAAATLAAGATGLWFAAAVLTERADLRAAKADAYDSLHVLFEAKAAASAMRADVSLWLLDPTIRADMQGRIDASAHTLIGADLTQSDVARPLLLALGRSEALERGGAAAQALADAPHPGGLLGTELDNITFVGERDAATDSVRRLADAEGVIRAVQVQDGQAQDGQAQNGLAHALAVDRWLTNRPDGGDAAFAALQAALDRTIAINQGEFDRRVTSALATATLMPAVSCGGLTLAALLAALGLWLRLREYR